MVEGRADNTKQLKPGLVIDKHAIKACFSFLYKVLFKA